MSQPYNIFMKNRVGLCIRESKFFRTSFLLPYFPFDDMGIKSLVKALRLTMCYYNSKQDNNFCKC